MRYLAILALVAFLVVPLAGCKKEEPTPPTPEKVMEEGSKAVEEGAKAVEEGAGAVEGAAKAAEEKAAE
jgi:hypothetical protein